MISEKSENSETVQRSQNLKTEKDNPDIKDLKLPNLSKKQMEKGLSELKSMSSETIAQMAETLKMMDPRLMQNVYRSHGIDMKPEEIAKLVEVLTPETIDKVSSLGKPKTQKSSVIEPQNASSDFNDSKYIDKASEKLGKQLNQDPKKVKVVLSFIGKIAAFSSKISNFFKIFTTGNRKYYSLSVGVCIAAYYLRTVFF